MSKTEYYCNHSAGCPVGADCPKHILNSLKLPVPNIKFVHLEDNPDYCKKPNWYGYQVAEGEKK
jgi:hypothetical protein